MDKFFYTGASRLTPATPSLFGDPTGDGWFKMFEFFEVPSQMIGAIGPVAQGTNFDWLRQDTKPGLINLNLIIDEEVFFSVFGSQNTNFNQQLLSFDQLPNMLFPNGLPGSTGQARPRPSPLAAGTSPIPLVVTATLASGAPAAAYAMNNVGVVATDRLTGTLDHRMKASFAQFLSLRHGGSGFVFGYGSGATGQNIAVRLAIPTPRPRRTTRFRPTGRSTRCRTRTSTTRSCVPRRCRRRRTPTRRCQSANAAPCTWPPNYAGQLHGGPWRAKSVALPGFHHRRQREPGGERAAEHASDYPASQPFCCRRPSRSAGCSSRRTVTPTDATRLCHEQRERAGGSVHQQPQPQPDAAATVATGGLPPFLVPRHRGTDHLLCERQRREPVLGSGRDGAAATDHAEGAESVPRGEYRSASASESSDEPEPVPPQFDTKQHPYFRTEMLQKAMNLTTVRTHQYAVWITVGFFEVTRQGDLLMAGANAGTPAAALAFDILGPEIGASTGQTTRFRGFFLVDRLQLTGYDPNVIGSFRPAVVYRQTIE